MAREISGARYPLIVSDIHDYGYPNTIILDFLRDPSPLSLIGAVVTNPPFDLAKEFIRRALIVTEFAKGKVAILQRHEFDAPKTNRPLFVHPFDCKLILPRRPRWTDGSDKASPRFPYAWYVWDWSRAEGDPKIRWLDDHPYDPEADARDSYDLAVRTIGEKVRAGAEIPPFFQSTK
jgi:hypothetical protein